MCAVNTILFRDVTSLTSQPVFFLDGGVKGRDAGKNTIWANSPAFHDCLVCQSDDVDTLLDHKYVRID